MKKVRKAIIPVAGMGTRFLPVTKTVAKEMLPIVDKPAIDYIVDEAVKSGIEEILFITSGTKKILEDYYDRNFELEYKLESSGKLNELSMIKESARKVKTYFIRQQEPLGTAHAINLAKSFINDEPFAIFFGDDVFMSEVPALKQLIDMYEKYDANVIGCLEVEKHLVEKYGIIEYNKDNITIKSIVEKPKIEDSPSNVAGLGRYILKPEIFDCIKELMSKPAKGEYYLTDAMRDLMKTQKFYACKIEGKYFDIGNKLEYIKANIEFGLQNDELKEGLSDYLKHFN
ncbi:MAG TPA: UTP--glucose-1-phosphate uridylyltransferase [Tenericutes bacterium]|nr:UTP--glucose-1-phosphate uridylyltransferase [Mycoplasmatota bacterium]